MTMKGLAKNPITLSWSTRDMRDGATECIPNFRQNTSSSQGSATGA